MDAEKFDKVVMDLLYDELDELTRASAIRHTEQSGRAKALYSELRATREVGALPLVEPPPDLAAKILAAEERARAERPLRQRLGTLVSIAASYAMRPQLGMAAVLLLMVGSSLLLLRAKPGEPSKVQVTERGVPESEREAVAVVPVAPAPEDEGAALRGAPRPRAAESLASRDGPSERRAADADKKSAAPAPRREAAAEPALGAAAGAAAAPAAPSPAVADDTFYVGGESATAAPATGGGCEASLPRWAAIIASPTSPEAAAAARWATAECYQQLGRVEPARRAYTALLTVPAYSERARQALAGLPPPRDVAESEATTPRTRAAAKPAKPADLPAASTER